MRSIIRQGQKMLYDDGQFALDVRRKPSIFPTREAAQARADELGLAAGSYLIYSEMAPAEPRVPQPPMPLNRPS